MSAPANSGTSPTGGSGFDWQGAYRRLGAWSAALGQSDNQTIEETSRVLRARARALAQPIVEPAAGESIDLLVFGLAGSRFGLRIAEVETVMPLQGAIPVPCTPPIVHGAANYRGEILAVLDLRPYFGLPVPADRGSEGIAIVVATEDRRFAILAESLDGIESVAVASLAPMPAQETGEATGQPDKITSDMVVLLEVVHLAHDPSLNVNEEIA